MKFENLELNKELLKAVSDQGFTEATEIQQKAIPILLNTENDFVGQAQTGTGKTAAFVLPLLQKLDPSSKKVQALILTPTRELANQVSEEVKKLGKHLKLKSIAIFGGASYEKQKTGIRQRKPQIVIGTPGRVIDLMNQKILKFDSAEYFILDEADEMLNMGFLDDVQEIMASFNKEKRLWMFSATMPKTILQLIKKNFRKPEVVKIEKKTLSNEDISQRYYMVSRKNRLEALCRIIDTEPDMYGIIFCRTRMDTKELADELLTRGYPVETLHGDMGQAQRDLSMQKFKKQKVKLMICTDVAARGIDVNNLTHVVNYGVPQDVESYVHRIGRTGRAGMKGEALTFVDPRDSNMIRRIEDYTKKKMTKSKLPTVEDLKSVRIIKELDAMMPIVEAILDKGDNFKLDETFDVFQEALSEFSKEELLKIFFTRIFNKELKRYGHQDDLDAKEGKRSEKTSKGKRKKKAKSGNIRLFLNRGKDDGINLNILLDDFSKQTGIKRQQIQNVDLKGRFSFLEIPERFGDKVISNPKLKINNQKVRLEYTN